MSMDNYVRVSYCFWSSIPGGLYSSTLRKLGDFRGYLTEKKVPTKTSSKKKMNNEIEDSFPNQRYFPLNY